VREIFGLDCNGSNWLRCRPFMSFRQACRNQFSITGHAGDMNVRPRSQPKSLRGGPRCLERFSIIPRHPAIRSFGHFIRMTPQFCQVFQRVGTDQLARLDQAHEHVADPSAVLGFVEERIFPLEYHLLQCPFADVIVQRGARFTKEQCEFYRSFLFGPEKFTPPLIMSLPL
jgi:hypothetical protein